MSERDIDTVEDLVEKSEDLENEIRKEVFLLAYIYKALGNEARIAVLLQLEKDKPVSQLTDDDKLDMTRSGLQKNIERLITAGLVYRPTESSQTYGLTVLGEFFVNEIYDEQEHIEDVLTKFNSQLEQLREQEEETLERMKDAGVDTKELENKLRAEAWEDLE